MEQLTTTNILSLFETSRAQRVSFVQDLIDRMSDGDTDPLKVHLQMKSLADIINSATNLDPEKNKHIDLAKKYKGLVLDAAQKHGKKFSLYNSNFNIQETGTKYDYSQCGDQELTDLLSLQESINAKVKSRQDFLKTVPLGGLSIVDETSGSVTTVYPPSKSSTTSVVVNLK